VSYTDRHKILHGNSGTGYKFPSPAPRVLQYERIVARPARVAVPGIPYHVTHRGNRRQDVFFSFSSHPPRLWNSCHFARWTDAEDFAKARQNGGLPPASQIRHRPAAVSNCEAFHLAGAPRATALQ